MTGTRREHAGPAGAARAWYQTGATAALVAPLLLVAGRSDPAIAVGGLLVAAAAATAVVEGNRRARGAVMSVLAVGLLAGCSIAAALACLIGIVTIGLHI